MEKNIPRKADNTDLGCGIISCGEAASVERRFGADNEVNVRPGGNPFSWVFNVV